MKKACILFCLLFSLKVFSQQIIPIKIGEEQEVYLSDLIEDIRIIPFNPDEKITQPVQTIEHLVPSDTISLYNNSSRKHEKIVFDFGSHRFRHDLTKVDPLFINKYIKSHEKYAGYVDDVLVIGNLLYFTDQYDGKENIGLCNTDNGHVIIGTFHDDIFHYLSNPDMVRMIIRDNPTRCFFLYTGIINGENPLISKALKNCNIELPSEEYFKIELKVNF